jgi:hypothetical protein
MNVNLMGPQTSEWTISKGLVVCFPPSFRTATPLSLPFTKQRGWRVRKFSNVHIAMSIGQVQMAKAAAPKLENAISRWILHLVGPFCSVYLHKIDFVQIFFAWRNHNGFTIV